jgi:hypothetical protein
MSTPIQPLEAIHDIKRMMERSSRFISLSGWSGISAGITALAGGWAAHRRIVYYYDVEYQKVGGAFTELRYDLILIAFLTFTTAFVLATFFTFIRSKKQGVAIWGSTARRLMWNTFLPLAIGAILIWHILEISGYQLVAPSCLLFYGLALVNGSKYTIGEVRWLGYGEIILGIINLWNPGHGLFFWTLGFGLLHVIYGFAMWWKYERLTRSTGKAERFKAD